ncbi:MAG: small subunit ribosomal protein S1, partial [Gammaproteobacteria bacterium]
DRKRRVINLSIKAKESEDEAAVLQEYTADNEGSATTTLGDLLKQQLDGQ